jgi:hypothetical protein
MEGRMTEHGYRGPAGVDSPASKAMDQAIDLAIAEKSPYPERAAFINAGTAHTDGEMKWAAKDGYAVVLVAPDLSTRVVAPEEILGAGDDSAQPAA